MRFVVEIDNDLFDQQAHDPLLGAGVGLDCVPNTRQVASQAQQGLAIDRGPCLELVVQPSGAPLESGDTLERGVPSGLQLARDVPLGRVHVVVAAFGKRGFAAGLLEFASHRAPNVVGGLHGLVGREQRRVHGRLGHGLEKPFDDRPVDPDGHAARWLAPLHERLLASVLAASRGFADDTPLPVLDPGRGRTKIGRLWAYACDDRPWSGPAPPTVAFVYAEDRKGARPAAHLAGFSGPLQVDGDSGFKNLPVGVELAFCWAHCRRRFYEVHQATASPIAAEALSRIAVSTPLVISPEAPK